MRIRFRRDATELKIQQHRRGKTECPPHFFVTGASSGIGSAFAALAPADTKLHTFSRRPGPGNWTKADLSTPDGWFDTARGIAEHLEAERPNDAILFHAAGNVAPFGPVSGYTPEEYARVIGLNITSALGLTEAFLRTCNVLSVRATIALTGSPAAKLDIPNMAHYSTGKDAIEHWARIVAAEQTADSGHRIITVIPHATLTDPVREILRADPTQVPLTERFRSLDSNGGFATPEQSAKEIWEAVSNAANGAAVPVGEVTDAEEA